MEIKTKEELFKVITDLQTQVTTMQETLDKLPSQTQEDDKEDKDDKKKEEAKATDEEVSDIDKLLQEN